MLIHAEFVETLVELVSELQSARNLWLTMKLILLNPMNLLFEVGLQQQHGSPFTLQVQGLEGLRKYWVHDHRCQPAPHSRRP